jgi:phosphohistidine phosphatase
MRLLIVRHAIAPQRDAKRWPDDSDRPLTAEGVRRARRAAAGLKRILKRPDLVLTSPWVRARDTATILTQAARWPKAVACDALVPGRSPEEMLEALKHQRVNGCLAVVGHQPGLGRLLALCLHGDPRPEAFELRKSAVVSVEFAGPPRAGQGMLTALLPPRILRKL